MKTLTDFLKAEQAQTENALTQYVIDTILEREEEEREGYMQNVMQRGCTSGTVGELIYYYQTYDFFDKFSSEIFELAQETYNDYDFNIFDKILKEEGDVKNTLAWFAYEETVNRLYSEWESQQ